MGAHRNLQRKVIGLLRNHNDRCSPSTTPHMNGELSTGDADVVTSSPTSATMSSSPIFMVANMM